MRGSSGETQPLISDRNSTTRRRSSAAEIGQSIIEHLRHPLSPRSAEQRRRDKQREELEMALNVYSVELRAKRVTSDWRPEPFPPSLSRTEDIARRIDPTLFGWAENHRQDTGNATRVRRRTQIDAIRAVLRGEYLDLNDEDAAIPSGGTGNPQIIPEAVAFGPAPFETCVERCIREALKERNIGPTEGKVHCEICKDEVESGETVVSLLPCDCGTVYHKPCIDVWLRIDPRCPTCRQNVFPDPVAEYEAREGHGGDRT